jgi:hypothetical protein
VISRSVQRRHAVQGVRSIHVQARVGPIPGRGIVLIVSGDVAREIKVGDKVSPEFEEAVYEVKGIERRSSDTTQAGLIVGRPLPPDGVSAVAQEDDIT